MKIREGRGGIWACCWFKSVWRQPRVEMLLDERLLGPCGCSDGHSHSSNVPSPGLSILGSHRELLRLPRRCEMSAQHTTAGSQCPPLPKDGVHHLRTMHVAEVSRYRRQRDGLWVMPVILRSRRCHGDHWAYFRRRRADVNDDTIAVSIRLRPS